MKIQARNNVGNIDRNVRLVAGVLLLAFAALGGATRCTCWGSSASSRS